MYHQLKILIHIKTIPSYLNLILLLAYLIVFGSYININEHFQKTQTEKFILFHQHLMKMTT
jgi:nitrate/nitrite transporter NarK